MAGNPIHGRFEVSPTAVALAGGLKDMAARFADRLGALIADHGAPYRLVQHSQCVRIRHRRDGWELLWIAASIPQPRDGRVTFEFHTYEGPISAGIYASYQLDPDFPAIVQALICEWPEVIEWRDYGFTATDAELRELMQRAIEIVRLEQKASTAFLQRRMQIGYQTAAKVIEMLEEANIISPWLPSGARQIFVSPS